MADVEFSTAKPNLNDLESRFTKASASAAASLQLHEDTDNGTNKITVTAPATIASDKTLALPDKTGNVIADDGSGNITGLTAIGGNSNLGLWIGSAGSLIEEEVRLDGATGNVIFNSTRQIVIGSSGVASPDTGIKRAAAGIIKITDSSTGAGALQLQEMTAPSAPGSNEVRIYAEDNGSGKTRLMAKFPTGAAVQIAIEP
jgi:hypothetical protein